jgi:hypothetical protein
LLHLEINGQNMESDIRANPLTIAVALGEGLDSTPISVIRTETVLSKLPIHNLSKSGKVDINIVRRNEHGRVQLQWEVSYNSKYGQPRQLAYKLDTLIINRHIDEQRRPVPKMLRLGSLSRICAEFDMPASGKNVNNLKKAILQNAGVMITAKLSYRGVDGSDRKVEAAFTRYSVIFTGERLPDGREADGVYLVFNDPYWDVLNNAPVRPLNYSYLKQLPPAPQRCYEILSYRMYVALKYGHTHAKLAYSEYCTYSAQTRYFDYEHFKKQMYKLHRPHLQAGYISAVSSEPALDQEGRPDWILYYQPGPKALAEYTVFTNRQRSSEDMQMELFAGASADSKEEAAGAGPPLFEELVHRGISPAQARKTLREVGNSPRILDQLEWGDYLLGRMPAGRFYNPPGFYVYLIRENILPPPSFQTTRSRATGDAVRGREQVAAQETLRREMAYEAFVRRRMEEHAERAENRLEYQRLVECKRKELLKHYRSLELCDPESLRELAHSAALAELARSVPVPSFAEFCQNVPTY